MDLTERQRKVLFAALVVLLVVAGVFLTLGGGGRNGAGAGRRTARSAAAPSATPTAVAPVTGAPPAPGSYDIFSLLPFSRTDFSTAADVARRFTAAYGSYRYDESPAVYSGRLRPLVTTDLAAQLQRDSAAPGIQQQRTKDQEISTSEARLDALRDLQKDQLIFLVTDTQHISRGGRTSDATTQYAVTTTRSGGGWVVFAFQPADIGDK